MPRFILLSDLHLKDVDARFTPKILRSLFQTLAAGVNSETYLLFAGDLAHGGKAAQYQDLLQQMVAKLDTLGLTRERRIIIPGNHDVDCDALEPHKELFKEELDKIVSLEKYEEYFPYFQTQESSFSNFLNFQSQFASMGVQAPRGTAKFYNIGHNIDIYCLNSAFFSAGRFNNNKANAHPGEIVDENNMVVNINLFEHWLKTSEAKFKVVLSHHPLDWMNDWCRSKLEYLLSNNCDIFIHGHIHNPFTQVYEYPNSSFLNISAPPLYTWLRNPTRPYSSFSVFDLDESNGKFDFKNYVFDFEKSHQFANKKNSNVKKTIIFDGTGYMETPEDQNYRAKLASNLEAYLTRDPLTPNKWIEINLAEKAPAEFDPKLSEPYDISSINFTTKSTIVWGQSGQGLTILAHKIALNINQRSPSCRPVVVALPKLGSQGIYRSYQNSIQTYLKSLVNGQSIDSITHLIVESYDPQNSQHQEICTICKSLLPHTYLTIITEAKFNARYSKLKSLFHDSFQQWYIQDLSLYQTRSTISYIVEKNDIDQLNEICRQVSERLKFLGLRFTVENISTFTRAYSHFSSLNQTQHHQIIERVVQFVLDERLEQIKDGRELNSYHAWRCFGYICMRIFDELQDREHVRSSVSVTIDQFRDISKEYQDKFAIYVNIGKLVDLFRILGVIDLNDGYVDVIKPRWFYIGVAYGLDLSRNSSRRKSGEINLYDQFLERKDYIEFPQIVDYYSSISKNDFDLIDKISESLSQFISEIRLRYEIPEDFNRSRFLFKDLRSSKNISDEMIVVDQATRPIGEEEIRNQTRRVWPSEYIKEELVRQSLFNEVTTMSRLENIIKCLSAVVRNSENIESFIRINALRNVYRGWLIFTESLFHIAPHIVNHDKVRFDDIEFILNYEMPNFEFDQKVFVFWENIGFNVANFFTESLSSSRSIPLHVTLLADPLTPDSLKDMAVLQLTRENGGEWWRWVGKYLEAEDADSLHSRMIRSELIRRAREPFTSNKDRQILNKIVKTSLGKARVDSLKRLKDES